MSPNRSAAYILAVLLAPGVTAEEPKPTGLMETVEKRLVQLDVAVEGDRETIRNLKAEDFALYVGEHAVEGLILDRLCGDEPAPAPAEQPSPTIAPAPPPPAARPRVTFVFFFDQYHLTMAGRAQSIEMTRDLINRLIVGGSQASILSNARRLETIVPMTTDRNKLLAGLERVRDDPRQWESYASREDSRHVDIAEELRWRENTGRSWNRQTQGDSSQTADDPNNPEIAPSAGQARASLGGSPCLLARVYAREEWQLVRQTTQRLGIVVGTLSEYSAPKGLVYFGDNLRQKAGQHYLRAARCPAKEIQGGDLTPAAAVEIDSAINQATARGVHFFTIQAGGLIAYVPGGRDFGRQREAQDTLVGLAAETGGEAFLGGASSEYIAGRIDELTSCRLLLNFPPGDLPRDKSMNVTLVLSVPKVKIRTQGRIVVPSAASLERSGLLAAFVDPASNDDGSLRALLIPRGGDGKSWRAGVQLRLRPTGLPDNSAELGASIVRRGAVTDHFASSIATKSGARMMVLEKTLDLAPGEFSIVAVARDAKRGDIGSTRIQGEWPSAAKSDAAIAPIAVLQTGPAAISKDGAASSTGSIARDVDEMLDPAAPISLESVVCRGPRVKDAVVVERWLDGDAPDGFEPVTIADSEGPCVQTVDVLSAGRLKSGVVVDYRIVARIGDEIVAQERRTLRISP